VAFSASGLYVKTFLDVFDVTQLAIDLDSETQHRGAMFTNTVVVDYSVDTAYGVAPYNANEVSGTGYTAGGELLTGTTFVESGTAGTVKFDATDLQWLSSTITNARGLLVYADGLAGNNAEVGITFGADFSTNNGTFLVQFHANGIYTVDLVP
jgi:hypothetical protein